MSSEGKVGTHSALITLSQAAVAVEIMAKRLRDANAGPASPSSSMAPSSSSDQRAKGLGMNKRAGYDDEINQVSSSSSPSISENSGQEMTFLSKPPAPVVRRSINAYGEADSPLDMSLKKSKRKWSSTDLDGSQKEEDEWGSKRKKRPSVITCVDRKLSVSCDSIAVDEHFRRSLGIESYNWIFNQAEKMPPAGVGSSGTSSETATEVPTSTTGKDSGRGKKTDISLKVDEHFAKSLGKSTWMRLKGL